MFLNLKRIFTQFVLFYTYTVILSIKHYLQYTASFFYIIFLGGTTLRWGCCPPRFMDMDMNKIKQSSNIYLSIDHLCTYTRAQKWLENLLCALCEMFL